MPALARKAGTYAGKASKFVNKIKREINEELKADELKEIKDQLNVTGKDSVIPQAFKETKAHLGPAQPSAPKSPSLQSTCQSLSQKRRPY